jgi:hypothetical protein
MTTAIASSNKSQSGVDAKEEQRSSFLHIRATPRNKATWVRAANRERKNLEQWATERLNRAAQAPD